LNQPGLRFKTGYKLKPLKQIPKILTAIKCSARGVERKRNKNTLYFKGKYTQLISAEKICSTYSGENINSSSGNQICCKQKSSLDKTTNKLMEI